MKKKLIIKKKDFTKFVVFTIVIFALVILILFQFRAKQQSDYDNFAKCLASKDVKMYGAYWCGHCNNQKKAFGESWKYINYIECSLPDGTQAKECEEEGIEGYPTWVIDGKHYPGEQSLETLAELSGCELI